MLYAWTTRVNYIIYNAMCIMLVCGILHHIQVRFGHQLGGLHPSPIELKREDIKFELREVDQFL